MELLNRLQEAQKNCLEIFQAWEHVEVKTLDREADFLKTFLEQLLPVLPDIDYQLETKYYYSGQEEDQEEWDFFAERGITLIYEYYKRMLEQDTSWEETGYQVNYTRSGKLLRFDRHGRGSVDPGEKNYWEVKISEITPYEAVIENELAAVFERVKITLAAAMQRAERRNKIKATG